MTKSYVPGYGRSSITKATKPKGIDDRLYSRKVWTFLLQENGSFILLENGSKIREE